MRDLKNKSEGDITRYALQITPVDLERMDHIQRYIKLCHPEETLLHSNLIHSKRETELKNSFIKQNRVAQHVMH